MHAVAGRAPRQARGHRRVDAILDAAAELVAEVGVADVTVGAIAERARTSKGSLYHFFVDRESVLHALAARHVAAIHRIVDTLRADTAIDWRALSADVVVARMLDPFQRYANDNPDLARMLRAPASQDGAPNPRSDVFAALHMLVGTILDARHPRDRKETRVLRATTITAVVDGVSVAARTVDEPTRATMFAEMRRVIASYLRSF